MGTEYTRFYMFATLWTHNKAYLLLKQEGCVQEKTAHRPIIISYVLNAKLIWLQCIRWLVFYWTFLTPIKINTMGD